MSFDIDIDDKASEEDNEYRTRAYNKGLYSNTAMVYLVHSRAREIVHLAYPSSTFHGLPSEIFSQQLGLLLPPHAFVCRKIGPKREKYTLIKNQ